jgi:hypothetical protein
MEWFTEPKLVQGQDRPASASRCDATARHPSPAFMSEGLEEEARLRASRSGAASFACIHERRMVDLTGIEPVTS